MKINLDTVIEKRVDFLDDKKKQLNYLSGRLILSDAIEFSISEINESCYPRIKGKKVGIDKLRLLESIGGPIIYIFEIKDEIIIPRLLEKMADFRNVNKKNNKYENFKYRSTSKIPKNVYENSSKILYVGSAEKNIHSRINQHLGFGHHDTFALQLKHWAEKDWCFNFYFIEAQSTSTLKDIEAAIALELNPLIGKREK